MRIQKLLGLLLATLFLFIVFFSALFIGVEMGHHDCTGEDCPVCAAVEECINNIRTCGTAATIVVVVCASLPIIKDLIFRYRRETVQEYNLISNRVRLDY